MTDDEIRLVHALGECRARFRIVPAQSRMFPQDGAIFGQAIETCQKLVMARATGRNFPGLFSTTINGAAKPGEMASLTSD